MDFMRAGYFSEMVLWEGGDPIPGYWFPAPDGAEVLQDFSPFRARRIWDHPEDEPTPLGESAIQPWRYRGTGNTIGYDGTHFCGPSEAFAEGGVPGVTPEILTFSDGSAACCDTPTPPPAVPTFWTFQSPTPARIAGISSPWIPGTTGWVEMYSRSIGASPPIPFVEGWDVSFTDLLHDPVPNWYYRTTIFRRIIDGTEPFPFWSVEVVGEQAWIGAGFATRDICELQDAETLLIPMEELASDLTVTAPQLAAGPAALAVAAYVLTSGADPIAKSPEFVVNANGFPWTLAPAFRGQRARDPVMGIALTPERFVTIPSGIITAGWMTTWTIVRVPPP